MGAALLTGTMVEMEAISMIESTCDPQTSHSVINTRHTKVDHVEIHA